MDLLKLNPITYQPTDLVEGHTSLIWTERYSNAGEFSLKTPLVEQTLNMLKDDDLVSLLDTKEVMVVENRSVKINKQGIAELAITGRSFETFAEQRPNHRPLWLVPPEETGAPGSLVPLGTVVEIPRPIPAAMAVAGLYYPGIVARSPFRVNPKPGYTPNPSLPPFYDNDWGTLTSPIEEVVPWTMATDSTINSDWTHRLWEYSKDRYKDVVDILTSTQLGIRTIRPTPGIAIEITMDENGNYFRTFSDASSKLRFDVYNGLDRTESQSQNSRVIFEYALGHIDEPSYLFSKKEYKNVAYAAKENDPLTYVSVSLPGTSPFVNGRDRKVLVVSIPAETPTSKIPAMALVELAKHNQALIFDGKASSLSPYKYKRDYNLGDLVTLRAQYGVNETLRVSEYIRSQDLNGENEYPTFAFSN